MIIYLQTGTVTSEMDGTIYSEMSGTMNSEIATQVTSLRKPAKTADEVLSALKKCDLPKTVQKLEHLIRTSTVT